MGENRTVVPTNQSINQNYRNNEMIQYYLRNHS